MLKLQMLYSNACLQDFSFTPLALIGIFFLSLPITVRQTYFSTFQIPTFKFTIVEHRAFSNEVFSSKLNSSN